MKTWGAHFFIIRDRLLTHIIEIVLERILSNEFVYFIQDHPRILHQALVLNQHESGGLHSMYSLSECVKGIAYEAKRSCHVIHVHINRSP